jgi:hypothetical protein
MIVDSFNLINRGIVLVTDKLYDLEVNNYSNGDEIVYNDKVYIIKTVEALAKNINGQLIDYLSFITEEK